MASYDLSVIGAGYVGLVTAAGLTAFGHRVRVAEADAQRLDHLELGKLPFHEPGLDKLVAKARRDGTIEFHGSNATAATGARAVFVAVPTPAAPDGSADLSIVEKVVLEIAPEMAEGSLIVMKSTVLPGTSRRLQAMIADLAPGVVVASNPEFLRQGRAVEQFLNPDRIVIGADDEDAQAAMMSIYASVDCPLVVTDPTSAELIKYGANALLATRISFINGMARIAALIDANISDVATGIGHDLTIGRGFLNPGPGFGGSCLPKDTLALQTASREAGYDFGLLASVLAINEQQTDYVVRLVEEGVGALEGSTIGLWGLAFKAGTDDTRESPACKIAARLVGLGATVRAYDPMVATAPPGTQPATDPIDAARGADALVVATEWSEFTDVDMDEVAAVMQGRLLVDARNLIDPASARSHGFDYVGIGRR